MDTVPTTTVNVVPGHSAGTRCCDGVICFGGADWWYHNHGHYDLQMMRQLSQQVPVLYVNSIGIRFPSVGEGRMFWRRIGRKLRSLRRGFHRVSERFAVISPLVVPGRMGMRLSRRWLAPQVRWAAKRLGIRRPLIWVECPAAEPAIAALEPVAVVYQRTDRWERFPEADGMLVAHFDRQLKAIADLTLYCSTLLFEEEGPECRHAAYVDHGVEAARFAAAGMQAPDPPDVAGLGRPRVGYIGSMDPHTFDAALLAEVAGRLPEVTFVLVGPSTLPAGWCQHSNVHALGPKPYANVPAYMAACDVLIMPWNQSEWIRACNPVKLKEYLAAGRPVVSTPFAELKRYEGLVRTATGAEAFAEVIRTALREPSDAEHLRQRVAGETWEQKAALVRGHLEALGITWARDGVA